MKRGRTRAANSYAPQAPGGLEAFDYQPQARIIFGMGAAGRIGELASELGAKKVLIVTDKGIVASGHLETIQKNLSAAGLKVAVFDGVRENPTTRDVAECLAVAKRAGSDAFVGLGGGSSIDTAKGCNFLLTNGGKMEDYQGFGKAKRPMLPLIAVPTTAGTGSECQSFAIIADETSHQKMACGDAKAAARIAVLDPLLTLSQPARVTACTGIDAITHALESAVTRKRNAVSAIYAREAFRLTHENLAMVLRKPDALAARAGMLLGAAFAGIAIENSMLGAAHALANPLTAHFNVTHGQAVGMMMPWVVRYNARDRASRKIYAGLAQAAELTGADTTETEAVEALIGHLGKLLRLCGFPKTLGECGVRREALRMLSQEAAKQWTGTFNPRQVTGADFEKLYLAGWAGR